MIEDAFFFTEKLRQSENEIGNRFDEKCTSRTFQIFFKSHLSLTIYILDRGRLGRPAG